MRYLVIVFMLICSVAWGCDYCEENPGYKELVYACGNDAIKTEPFTLLNAKLNILNDTLNKIYVELVKMNMTPMERQLQKEAECAEHMREYDARHGENK